MKIFPFIKSLVTSPARSIRKREVKKDIINTDQANKGIANIYRKNPNNAGDLYSSPVSYFPELGKIEVDIFDFKNSEENGIASLISDNSLVIGGGGLLNRKCFQFQLGTFEKLRSRGKKTVLWGVGHNSQHRKDFKKLSYYSIDLDKFGLVGTRDHSLSPTWVPCVSCMNHLFDSKSNSRQELGVILHDKTYNKPRHISRFDGLPLISNRVDIETYIAFIKDSEYIITDSYHAMYWGMLLEKKVLVIPNSSKFFDFKYDPGFSNFENCLQDLKKARSYSGVLEECRERNLDFASKVFNYLN